MSINELMVSPIKELEEKVELIHECQEITDEQIRGLTEITERLNNMIVMLAFLIVTIGSVVLYFYCVVNGIL